MSNKLAIDIGSSYTKIYKAGADVVLYEPTIIAIENNNYKKPVAVGYDAEKLIGKTTENVKIIYPVKNSKVDDSKALSSLLLEFMKKIKGGIFESRPQVLFTVQCGATRESIKNFENVLNSVGIYDISYAEAPVLSAIGIDAPVSDNNCVMVIDFGGGQTTICALTLGGVIAGVSAELGGNNLNEMIISHLTETMGLTLSFSQTEELKQSISSLVENDNTKRVVCGKDNLSGKTRSTNINANQILLPVKEFVDKIISITNMLLGKLPQEAELEIQKNGIYLVGGGSKLYGLSDYLSNALKFRINTITESELSSIIGGGTAIENKELLNKIKLLA